jgi:bacterioferritin
MKGFDRIIVFLNARLAEELAAISQYVVNHELLDLWGYKKLADPLFGNAKQEMGHAERLIERLVFLEGKPIVTKLGPITIGDTVPTMLEADLAAEGKAIDGYNEGLKIAIELKDGGTHELLQDILEEEEAHHRYLEGELTKLKQLGLPNYLGTLA